MCRKHLLRLTILASSISFLYACKKPDIDTNNGMNDESVNYTVTTFAGNGTIGIDPATGNPFYLDQPIGMAFDAAGNLYVGASQNNKIFEINNAGAITAFAGSISGYDDGTGAAARFLLPATLTLDNNGNVYVAEFTSPRIRKITQAGVVTTLTGNGIAGCVDGAGAAAQVDMIYGMVCDNSGNTYFTQKGFNGIRKVSATGVVSTFAGGMIAGFGEGTGVSAKFNEPGSLTKDNAGNIYVSDLKNKSIRKITQSAVVSTIYQNANEIYQIASDASGNLFMVQGDLYATIINKLSTTGTLKKIAGGPQGFSDGPGNNARFGYISCLAVNANGDLFVSELAGAIRKIKRN